MTLSLTRRFQIILLALANILSAHAYAQKKTATEKTDTRVAGLPAAMARGNTVYRDRCEICHFSESDAKKLGPGLKEIYKRGKFANGSKVDDASMEKWIVNGGKDMPPFGKVLNAAQIHDLIAYLKTI
jgi:cytochrome c2